jgi:hypothetical protein
LTVPEQFCWVRLRDDAGLGPGTIIESKEHAREQDDGDFLWGFGLNIERPMGQMVNATSDPVCLFTPMLTPPKVRSTVAEGAILWRGAMVNGSRVPMPTHARVTSGKARTSQKKPRRWALVCRSEASLSGQTEGSSFSKADVWNFPKTPAERPKNPGDQQTTVPVTYHQGSAVSDRNYRVLFRAQLAPPYLVELTDPVPVPSDMARRYAAGEFDALDRLVR